MREQIEILAALQNVDRQIKEQNGIKQELLGELKAGAREIETKKKEIEYLTAAFAEKEKLRLEKDRVLQDEGKKAMDKRMRMNRIKNAKELQALQREIDQIKQNNGELEDELIRIMEEIDALKADIAAKEAEVAKLQESWKQKQEMMQSQIGLIEEAVTEASTPVKAAIAEAIENLN